MGVLRGSLVAVAVLFMCGAAGATGTESCICRNGIVSRGDLMAQVIQKCGEPAQKFQREEARVSRGVRHTDFEKVTVDDWTYNFGPNEFMYSIQFENGRVERIESLDYGY